jgi:hypothetical protein
MFFLDAAVVVGILLILTKVTDLLLRPHQQARLQALVESAALKLSYASMIAAARRLARRRFWRLALLVAALVPLQMYLSIGMLQKMFRADPRTTPELVGLVVVLVFFVETLAAIPAAFAFKWVLRDDSSLRTAIRYGSLLMLLMVASLIGEWIVGNNIRWQNRVLNRMFGLIFMVGGSVVSALFIAAWIFALALLLHLLLRLLNAIVWRVVEYQRGAWAAVVAIATAVLGFVDLYLKHR